MSQTTFSLVYPTRHRPQFIEMALKFLEYQDYDNFEVIVCDNYLDHTLSCRKICEASPVKNVKYVKPSNPFGMVENWNYALQFATGEYVCFFTDKMLLLPGTLSNVNNILNKEKTEIINWVNHNFTAEKFPDYFGAGTLRYGYPSIEKGACFQKYDPTIELKKKAWAAVSRFEQDKSHYARGKICFGGFSQSLISRIIDKTGKLFHNISPDYTSMILGLSFAESALEINRPGIVHIGTDLSNGGQSMIKDEIALNFLNQLENYPDFLQDMLIPELYVCSHNLISHDYISLKNRYNLKYTINKINWLTHICEDFDIPGRKWSNTYIEQQQRNLYHDFVKRKLDSAEQNSLKLRLKKRADLSLFHIFKNALKPFLPAFILESYRNTLRRRHLIQLKNLTDILILS